MFSILVVEPDIPVRNSYRDALESKGYTVKYADSILQAHDIAEHSSIDLVITELNLPDGNGTELIKSLGDSDTLRPVIVVSSSYSIFDKEKAFLSGADDFLIKPVLLNELIWRVEAIMRRYRLVTKRKTSIGSTVLDCDALTVTEKSKVTELPQKEFFLLYKLISSINRIFTRQQIMEDVWGIDSETDMHTLEVHVSRLRERFYNNPDFEIVTVRGVGYKAINRRKSSDQ